MAAKDRATIINKLYKTAKKHYQEIKPPAGRSLLEHVIYACCLEDSLYVAADEAFARLQEDYFDWNEVRVTTVAELAEICKNLTQPEEAAIRIKKALHGIFETYYEFNIDILKKDNLGKTVAQFQKFRGVTPFVISYLAQHGLGGHSIPVDTALLNVMHIVGAISDSELAKSKVPGLERTIPKNKGIEFASVVHQLAAAFHKSQFNKDLRDVLLTIDSSAKERFPKRGGKKKEEEAPAKKATKIKAEAKPAAKPAKSSATKKAESEPPVKKKAKTAPKKAATKKAAAKKTPAKKAAAKKTPVKKTPVKKKAKVAKKTKATKKTTQAPKKKATKKKSSTRSLSKKKPK